MRSSLRPANATSTAMTISHLSVSGGYSSIDLLSRGQAARRTVFTIKKKHIVNISTVVEQKNNINNSIQSKHHSRELYLWEIGSFVEASD